MPAEQLSDARLIGGLLIAAASAAGFGHVGMPSVRDQTDGGVSAVLLLDSGHITVHSVPQRQILLLRVGAKGSREPTKAHCLDRARPAFFGDAEANLRVVWHFGHS